MDASKAAPPKEVSSILDATADEEYASLSKLLQEFTYISSIDKAWTFNFGNGTTDYDCNFFFLSFIFLVSTRCSTIFGFKFLMQEMGQRLCFLLANRTFWQTRGRNLCYQQLSQKKMKIL